MCLSDLSGLNLVESVAVELGNGLNFEAHDSASLADPLSASNGLRDLDMTTPNAAVDPKASPSATSHCRLE
jgi:hypothetical protein